MPFILKFSTGGAFLSPSSAMLTPGTITKAVTAINVRIPVALSLGLVAPGFMVGAFSDTIGTGPDCRQREIRHAAPRAVVAAAHRGTGRDVRRRPDEVAGGQGEG